MPEAAETEVVEGLFSLTLSNLGSGSTEELFQYELDKVIRNIADPNTDAEAKRKIMVEITFVPMGKERSATGVVVNVTSKLAGLKPVTSTAYLVEKAGKPMAVAKDIRQMDAFEKQLDPSVRPINATAQRG